MQNGQGDFGLLQLCSNDSSAIPHLVRMIKGALTKPPVTNRDRSYPAGAVGPSRLSAVPTELEAIRVGVASVARSSQAPAEMRFESPAASPFQANPDAPVHPVVLEGGAAVDPAVS